jgi:hypothetical protein
MLINVQVPEAAKLLWDLFNSLPEESRPLFAPRIDAMASKFEHPNLVGFIVCTISGDDTH